MTTRHAAEKAHLLDLTPEGESGGAGKRFRKKLAAEGFTVEQGFRFKPGYLYTVVRAISARVNQNWDGWPSEELRKSYKTFIGKPCFVNHENHDPTKARGVVVAARYVENGMDKYIETVMEIDAGRFPKLAHEIRTGGLDSVSMGAEAGFTICSYCHNKATDLDDMCDHVRNHKGKTLTRFDRRTGKREDVLVFESCHKISFFELSYVFEPADETAVASKVVVAGLNKSANNYDNDDEGRYDDIKRKMDDIFNDPAWADMEGVDNRSRWERPHGSVNGATWNVGLHLNNDYDHYHDGLLNSLRSANPSETLRRYVHHNAELDDEGKFGDVPRGYLHLVDWNHLTDPKEHELSPDDLNEIRKQYPDHFGDTRDPDVYLDPNDPRIRGASRRTAEDLTVPAPPGTPTIDQSVIDSTPVYELSPATELTGHEATGMPKESAFAADLAEITKLAGECPPGMDCAEMPDLKNELSQGGPVSSASSSGGGKGGSSASEFDISQWKSADEYAKAMSGKPYNYGGAAGDPGGVDCSGYMSDLYSIYSGKPTRFTTDSDFAALGFKPGYQEGAFNIGTNGGVGENGHMAGTLPDGTHVESNGSAGVQYGGAAAGATNPQFTQQWHYPINSGSQPAQRSAGKYTKEDFAVADGKKPWERDNKDSDSDDVAAIEIEAMLLTAGATDDYWKWKEEFGEDADKERGDRQVLQNPNLRQWIDAIDRIHRKWAKVADLDVIPENSKRTQRSGTDATYHKVHEFFDAVGAPNENGTEGVLDYGSGLGHSGRWGHTYEPYPDATPGVGNYPTWIDPKRVPAGKFHRVTNIHVLNVVPPEVRDRVVDGVKRSMAPGGHAVFVARSKSDVDSTKNKVDAKNGDPGAYHVYEKDKPEKRTYQKGFTPQELHQYISERMGRGYTVSLIPGDNRISSPAVHVVKNEAKPSRRKVRNTALKKIARSRAKKLAFGEVEAPMAVDTLREEGSAPEDDNNDFERYVDPPQELQTPDLSEAQQIDREQEEQEQQPAEGPGQQVPQQQYMTLQIPMPTDAPQVPQAAVPAQPQQAGPITASILDYFDRYYGHRVANWLDAIEGGRELNPAEVADFRRQAEKISTLENRQELSTTSRNPRKGADMARNSMANRAKVARTGRRQHFAEGPLVDGGDRSRNDQGEQEEAFISQTPDFVEVDAVTDDTPNIHNTEHNLVARVQRGRDQLLRDARNLAALRQRRAFDESGGPVAEVVDPQVNAGPGAEGLTGDDFVSANPNDGVVPTNPKDASLRAFAAFDSWLAQKTGSSSRRHNETTIKRAAAQFSREAGISPQALFPALGIVLREARKNDKKTNSTKGAKVRKRSNESLEVAAPDGRIDVEAPVSDTTDAEAQASQFDIHDFGNNAGDNVAKPDLSTDQNWAPGEASKTGARVKTAGGLLAMRCAEGMIAAGLEPNSRERKYQLAAEFENMNRGLIQDRVALLERFAAVRQADLRRVASGSPRGAARSPIPAGLGGGVRTAAAGPRVAAHDPSNDSTLFV